MTFSMNDRPGLQDMVTNEWSEWTEPVIVTQDMINQFADVTLDHQWIHTDVERAAAGPFGAPIAHGFLTLSLVSHFSMQLATPVADVAGVLNYGGDKLRFLAPVPVDSELRAKARVVAVTEKASGVLVKREIAVHVVGNETPAVLFESLGLMLG